MEIAKEFDQLLEGDSLMDIAGSYSLPLRGTLLEMALSLVAHNAGQYHRRVVTSMTRYPARALLLGKTQPFEDCQARRIVAGEMLDGVDGLDANAMKIAVLYRDDLRHARLNGECPPRSILEKGLLWQGIKWQCSGYCHSYCLLRGHEFLSKYVGRADERACLLDRRLSRCHC